jgi:predicted transcriptional regulator
MSFDEKVFLNTIIQNCKNIKDINELNINFDKIFNETITKANIDIVFDIYNKNNDDIEDAKMRYGKNYKEIKLNLILYNILLKYLRIV